MALVDLVMPKLGESIMEATILKWHKQPGDSVSLDETVLEIATDKVDSEVPSTAAGVIEELLWKVNDVVPIGSVIARIRTGALESASPIPAPISATPAPSSPAPVQEAVVVETRPAPMPVPVSNANNGSNKFYSPLVLNIAASEGVGLAELETIPGSGNEGRVTKKDILQYLSLIHISEPTRQP
jgi:2-oxoglutarate dehydrogenase E2 component (dihydrolipoamide succinyltransferase)